MIGARAGALLAPRLPELLTFLRRGGTGLVANQLVELALQVPAEWSVLLNNANGYFTAPTTIDEVYIGISPSASLLLVNESIILASNRATGAGNNFGLNWVGEVIVPPSWYLIAASVNGGAVNNQVIGCFAGMPLGVRASRL